MSSMAATKVSWLRRKNRVRKKVTGSPACPRLNVYRSNKHMYAQVIDDVSGQTRVAASTLSPELKGKLKGTGNREAAKQVGMLVAQKCLAEQITTVVFDRSGFLYHGRVKALADSAREGGLKF
jgi:large subunit ribosomal protein L18